jgi:hypothetical protein
MFNELEIITLSAFVTALAKLESPLTAKLQKDIHHIGQIFTKTPKTAIDNLLNLLENLPEDNSLKQLYWQARINIQEQYENAERNKYRNLKQESETNTTDPEMIDNLSLALPEKTITEIGQAILQSADSRAASQQNAVEIKLIIRRAF